MRSDDKNVWYHHVGHQRLRPFDKDKRENQQTYVQKLNIMLRGEFRAQWRNIIQAK